jgi:riboflavin kinase / FMN adenylyltransferase
MDSMKHGCVISIGVFDGVHAGHWRVLRTLRKTADDHGLPAVVVTFDPHPRRVLQPDKAPPMLASLQRRIELLESTGCVDHTFVLPFDQSQREQAAEDFVRHTLIEQLGMRALVVGENFACGKARAGTVEYLTRLGMSANFSVHPVRLHTALDELSAEPTSSTVIRRLILDGDVRTSARLLGRYHELECTVGSRGKLLLPAGMCVPRDGRYAVLLSSPQSDALTANVHIWGEGNRHHCLTQHVDFEPGTGVTVRFVDAIETVRRVQASV